VEKNQYELCLEVLRRLNKSGVLKSCVLIGSWCIPFYKDYFSKITYTTAIKTRDIDFLIPSPSTIHSAVNIPELLLDLGFIVNFRGPKGYIKLEHPDLLVEFLVIEKGKGTDRPFPLPKLGINAVALRFLSFLSNNTIRVKIEDFYLTLPHPANFALHKLIIFQRRLKEEKALKDRAAAIKVLNALIQKGEVDMIKKVFNSIPQKWQGKVIKGLEEAREKELLNLLR
jgi:hypothetical protein